MMPAGSASTSPAIYILWRDTPGLPARVVPAELSFSRRKRSTILAPSKLLLSLRYLDGSGYQAAVDNLDAPETGLIVLESGEGKHIPASFQLDSRHAFAVWLFGSIIAKLETRRFDIAWTGDGTNPAGWMPGYAEYVPFSVGLRTDVKPYLSVDLYCDADEMQRMVERVVGAYPFGIDGGPLLATSDGISVPVRSLREIDEDRNLKNRSWIVRHGLVLNRDDGGLGSPSHSPSKSTATVGQSIPGVGDRNRSTCLSGLNQGVALPLTVGGVELVLSFAPENITVRN